MGDVGHPEPTWWSDSAPKSWRDARDAVEADGVARASTGQEADAVTLGALLDQYESQLLDANRSTRWREEHAEWAQLKTEWLDFERGPDEQSIARAWQNVDRAKLERITALLAAGSHGTPGIIPDFVRISMDGEGQVTVENTREDAVNIIVSRLRTRARAARRCALSVRKGQWAAGRLSCSQGGRRILLLVPGRIALPAAGKHAARISDDSGNELVWITDSRVHLYLGVAPEHVDDLRRVRSANRAANAPSEVAASGAAGCRAFGGAVGFSSSSR